MWTKLNRLEALRPLVWINELPWSEMDDDELRRQAENPFCREVEGSLRRTRYRWRHTRTDIVVDSVFYSPLVYDDSGYGVEVNAVLGQSAGGFGSIYP